jgi:hypothetical protein
MSDVKSAFPFQALRGVASGVECKLLCTTAQKPDAASVSNANKQVQIQGERLGTGEDPATTPVLILGLDCIPSARDKLAQVFSLNFHA